MAAMAHPSSALPFTAALFDLDGCLLDTNDLIQRSFQHTFAECAAVLGLHESPAPSLIQSWFGEPLVTTFRRFSQDEATVAHCVAAYRAYNLAQHDALAREFDGLLAVVRHLAQCGVRLAVVTSKARVILWVLWEPKPPRKSEHIKRD